MPPRGHGGASLAERFTLSSTNVSLAEVAEHVRYGSEAALSRAFKRLVGVAPSASRRGARPEAA